VFPNPAIDRSLPSVRQACWHDAPADAVHRLLLREVLPGVLTEARGKEKVKDDMWAWMTFGLVVIANALLIAAWATWRSKHLKSLRGRLARRPSS
jgi:hypothetical protein